MTDIAATQLDAVQQVDPGAVTVTKLFPTPLASTIHPDSVALNAELADVITRHQACHPGVRHSNEGGWQSADDFERWSGPAGAALIAFGQSLANEMSAVMTADGALHEAALTFACSAWANINQAGDYNAIHGHAGSYWSGVYYVDDGRAADGEPVGGDIQFNDPRGLLPVIANPALRMRVAGCLTAGLSHGISPQSGMFLMFPSWLLHAVTRYTGTRKRISVAFNLWV